MHLNSIRHVGPATLTYDLLTVQVLDFQSSADYTITLHNSMFTHTRTGMFCLQMLLNFFRGYLSGG